MGSEMCIRDSITAGPNGVVYTASASALWDSADLGETWTESPIPTELSEVDVATIFIDDTSAVVELVAFNRLDRTSGATRVLRSSEVWHRPNSGEWALLESWENPADPFEYPEGLTVDAWPSLQAFNKERLSIRWNVMSFSNSGSDFASQGSSGAFLQKLPLG